MVFLLFYLFILYHSTLFHNIKQIPKHWYQLRFFAFFLSAFTSFEISFIVILESPYFSESLRHSLSVCLESSLLTISNNSEKERLLFLKPNLLYSRSDNATFIVFIFCILENSDHIKNFQAKISQKCLTASNFINKIIHFSVISVRPVAVNEAEVTEVTFVNKFGVDYKLQITDWKIKILSDKRNSARWFD
jgi:hypothetical protein